MPSLQYRHLTNQTQMIFPIINLIIIGLFLIWLYKKNDKLRKYFFLAAVFKLLCGLGIGLLYQYYYTFGDTYVFFNEAEALNKVASIDFGAYLEYLFGMNDEAFSSSYDYQPRALFLVKILSVINLLTGGDYWISSLYFSLFAFSGSWFAVTTFLKYYDQYKGAIILSFFYFPSVVFWSSGLIKESVAMGCIYIIVSLLLIFYQECKLNIYQILTLVLTLLILWNIKYYYAGIIILLGFSLLTISLITRSFNKIKHNGYGQIGLFFLLIVIASLVVTQLHPNFYLHRILEVIVDNYLAFQNISEPGDFVVFNSLEPNVLSFIYYFPKALISGLFRPFIGESIEPFKIVAGLENLLLAVLFIFALSKLPQKVQPTSRLLILTAIMFIVIMAVLLTLSSPNYGSLIRYKTGFLPFFVLLITMQNPWVNKLFS